MKTWTEKLNAPGAPALKTSPRAFADIPAGGTMLIPTAAQVDAFVRTIPPGVYVDARRMRRELAADNGAEATCPVTTGFHLRTVAEAAHEALDRGVPEEIITPYWRVLDAKSPTLRKLSAGADFAADRRRRERLPD